MRMTVRQLVIAILAIGCLCAGTSRLLGQEVKPERAIPWGEIPATERGSVLVLATPHLSSYGTSFNTKTMANLLALLEKHGPDLIGIEALPPFLIHDMRNAGEVFEPTLNRFAGKIIELGLQMQETLDVDWNAANKHGRELLFALEEADDEMRETLRLKAIPVLIAQFNLHNAALHWGYLPIEQRNTVPHLTAEMREALDARLSSSNENNVIAMNLARRLGLQQIYPIDDHRDKELYMPIVAEFAEELGRNDVASKEPWKPFFNSVDERQKRAYDSGDLLPYYLYINSREYALGDIDAQWQVFFRTRMESKLDRMRVALFELRNLRMAANIRRASALRPGAKILVIVGASHKSFIDAYLSDMMDLEVVHLSNIAKTLD